MLVRHIFGSALITLVAADWDIRTTPVPFSTAPDDAWGTYYAAESVFQSYLKEQLTADPNRERQMDVLADYVATRTDINAEDLLGTTTVVTWTTVPAWFKAMPTDMKNYWQSLLDVRGQTEKCVIDDTNPDSACVPPTNAAPTDQVSTNAAPKPTAVDNFIGIGLAAAAAGAVAML